MCSVPRGYTCTRESFVIIECTYDFRFTFFLLLGYSCVIRLSLTGGKVLPVRRMYPHIADEVTPFLEKEYTATYVNTKKCSKINTSAYFELSHLSEDTGIHGTALHKNKKLHALATIHTVLTMLAPSYVDCNMLIVVSKERNILIYPAGILWVFKPFLYVLSGATRPLKKVNTTCTAYRHVAYYRYLSY